jgi:catechol 2,3-dioxygenase-like lactoylglutathione lyase family enzyme
MNISGLQHVGIPVSDMDRSLKFYQEVLGLELLFATEGSGPEVSQAVGVPEAHLKFAFLRAGDAIFELLQYVSPTGKPYDRMNCDVGATHVAFEVPDIEAAYQELTEKGIKFNSAPVHLDEGPLAGCAFAYFPDPDGIQLEIFQTAEDPEYLKE